ncbi:MAG TPA: hypothetical protein PLQ76_07190 [bacterium]|nr:hypothetical protein [bacterium]
MNEKREEMMDEYLKGMAFTPPDGEEYFERLPGVLRERLKNEKPGGGARRDGVFWTAVEVAAVLIIILTSSFTLSWGKCSSYKMNSAWFSLMTDEAADVGADVRNSSKDVTGGMPSLMFGKEKKEKIYLDIYE